jgi:hypothetical protein
MRNGFFLLFVLLSAIVGIGFAAIAQDTRSVGSEAALLANVHAAKGVQCATCHETPTPQPVGMLKCVSCHGDKALAQKTANVKPTNPHESRHYGTVADCNLCHHQHKKSQNLCADCHPRFTFRVP